MGLEKSKTEDWQRRYYKNDMNHRNFVPLLSKFCPAPLQCDYYLI